MAESPAKSKCHLRRATDWRRRRGCSLYLSYRPAEPKRDVGPISCRDTILSEFLFQDFLECPCIRSFMLGCGCVSDYSTKAAQLSMNSLKWLHGFQPCPRDCNINDRPQSSQKSSRNSVGQSIMKSRQAGRCHERERPTVDDQPAWGGRRVSRRRRDRVADHGYVAARWATCLAKATCPRAPYVWIATYPETPAPMSTNSTDRLSSLIGGMISPPSPSILATEIHAVGLSDLCVSIGSANASPVSTE